MRSFWAATLVRVCTRLKNYYAILEVPVGCSLEEIRQAYRRLAQAHLDDEAGFAELKEAHEVLTTPTRRAEYDRAAWGEAFDTPVVNAEIGASPGGRCPMGAEAQCPVLQGRAAPSDTFCPDCGYAVAGLNAGTSFDAAGGSDAAARAWLEDRGQTYPLKAGANLVGRDGDVLIPDKTVSRSHARLELAPDGGSLSLEDLSSTNGTQVNEEMLAPHVPRRLADGDRLRFGSVLFTLHLPGPDAPDTAADALHINKSSSEARAQVSEMRDGSTGVYPLKPGVTTFGRRPENDVVLTGDLYVSGSHAQISADGDVFILTDIGSTNGTLLNGERLTVNTPVTLDTDDVIMIGGTTLRFERLGPNAEEPKAEAPDGEAAPAEASPMEALPVEEQSASKDEEG